MEHKILAVSVSNRQFVFLREAERNGGITLSRLVNLSQTTVGSVVRRGLLAWNQKVGVFALTAAGLRVLEYYKSFDITRADRTKPLSKHINTKQLQKARAAKA